MSPFLASTTLALLLSVGTLPHRPQETPVTYAALPIRNLSASPAAAGAIMDQLRAELSRRGAIFAPYGDLEQILRSRRIRYTDSVSRENALEIAAALGADYLLVGTLLDHLPGPNPRVSLAVRVVDAEGSRIQSSLVSLRGEDFRGLLGLGVITDAQELEAEVLARVLEDFTNVGAPARPAPSRPKRMRAPSSESFFLREGFDPSTVERVTVLPFTNRTPRPTAGLTFAEILGHQIFRSRGVEVVEQSELRAAMIAERVRSVETLDAEVMTRIGQRVGTRYFVVGSIEIYNEEVYVDAGRFPEVEASVQVLDVEQGLIVAAATRRRRGDQYHVILGLGDVHDLVALADRTARELVAMIGLRK